jgi:threonine/homoserine/homoserine lactone efflux protein
MTGWIIAAAFFAFIFWRIWRARENAAERYASGEARSPSYWTGVALAISVLALSMYMAHLNPSERHPALWLLAVVLFIATLLVRRALKWRYPH